MMNPSVASYILLLITSAGFIGLALRRFRTCVECPYPRDFKPAMLSIFISLAWVLVAIHGLVIKWGNPYIQLVPIDTPILILLVCATLYTLLYMLSNLYRSRCNEVKSEAGTVLPAVCRANRMGTQPKDVRSYRSSKTD